MRKPAFAIAVWVSLLASLGCQSSDREAVRERAERAKQKAEVAARQLRHDAKELGAKMNEKAEELGAPGQPRADADPEQKLKSGAAELKREGEQAGAKLSQMGQSAKVKYNLSAALGLSAVSKINVESSGSTVTLRGTVASAEGRTEAERVALGTAGVTKVVNELRVQP